MYLLYLGTYVMSVLKCLPKVLEWKRMKLTWKGSLVEVADEEDEEEGGRERVNRQRGKKKK